MLTQAGKFMNSKRMAPIKWILFEKSDSGFGKRIEYDVISRKLKYKNVISPTHGGIQFPDGYFEEKITKLDDMQKKMCDEVLEQSLRFFPFNRFLDDFPPGGGPDGIIKCVDETDMEYYYVWENAEKNEEDRFSALFQVFDEFCTFPLLMQYIPPRHFFKAHECCYLAANKDYGFLMVVKGASAGGIFLIRSNQFITIGRSALKSEIVLSGHPEISREHFRLLWQPQKKEFFVIDDSSNGLYYHGIRLEKGKQYRISSGDQIGVGGMECVVTVGENDF